MDSASVLRDVRLRSGLSVRALARAAEVSPASVDRIEHGRVRPTATLERLLASAGYRLVLRAEPQRAVPLTREDRRSLAFHRLVAAKLLREPDPVIVRAHRNLERMRSADASHRSRRDLDAWDDLLDGPIEVLVGTLLDPAERARDLRQVTPFAGVLTPAERDLVYPRSARS